MKRFSKTFHTVLKIISFTTEVEMQSFKGIFIQKCSETFLKTNKNQTWQTHIFKYSKILTFILP